MQVGVMQVICKGTPKIFKLEQPYSLHCSETNDFGSSMLYSLVTTVAIAPVSAPLAYEK